MATVEERWGFTPESCPKCGGAIELSAVYDAVACRRCDEWREQGCPAAGCWARCASRPSRPSAALETAILPPTSDGSHFLFRWFGRRFGYESQEFLSEWRGAMSNNLHKPKSERISHGKSG